MYHFRMAPKPSGVEKSLINCHPDGGGTKSRCESRGCTWEVSATPGVPSCSIPDDK